MTTDNQYSQNRTGSRTRTRTRISKRSQRYSHRSSSLSLSLSSSSSSPILRSIVLFCFTLCLLWGNNNNNNNGRQQQSGGRNSVSLLVSATDPDAIGAKSKKTDSASAAVAANTNNNNNDGAAPTPPEGLFERLDANHDNLLSKAEYTSGWPLIAREIGGSGSGIFNWLPANNGGFMKGFTSGVAMILATEIGDKTFFIAAVLSMRQKRSAVFLGAVLSLYVMTVLSSVMGLVLPKLVPVKYTHILGGMLFLYFGFKLLFDAKGMDSSQVSEELEEVEEELLHPKKDERDEESQQAVTSSSIRKGFSEVAVQSFTLTFLAEWGDRSQIATIALSAAKNPYGVTLGGCIGHTMCTGMAVLGGRMLAARISEKTVSVFGGVIFLVFGIHSVFFES